MRQYRKHFGMFIVAFIAISPILSAKSIKSDDISNMLIEGDNRLRVHAPEMDIDWKPDMYRDFHGFLKDPILISSLVSPAISDPEVTIPSRMKTDKGAQPWQSVIHEEPILTISVKKSKKDVPNQGKKMEWTFLVKDSQGRVFYEKKKKGVMPEILDWDGMGSGSKPLEVGYDYSYSLSIVDEAGNPQRHSGKPFSLQAFRYKQSGKTVTAFSPKLVFANASSQKISKSGRNAISELIDFVRPNYNKGVEVVVYELDEKFALARANAVAKYISANLEYTDDFVKVTGTSIKGKKGYSHVEIISK